MTLLIGKAFLIRDIFEIHLSLMHFKSDLFFKQGIFLLLPFKMLNYSFSQANIDI